MKEAKILKEKIGKYRTILMNNGVDHTKTIEYRNDLQSSIKEHFDSSVITLDECADLCDILPDAKSWIKDAISNEAANGKLQYKLDQDQYSLNNPMKFLDKLYQDQTAPKKKQEVISSIVANTFNDQWTELKYGDDLKTEVNKWIDSTNDLETKKIITQNYFEHEANKLLEFNIPNGKIIENAQPNQANQHVNNIKNVIDLAKNSGNIELITSGLENVVKKNFDSKNKTAIAALTLYSAICANADPKDKNLNNLKTKLEEKMKNPSNPSNDPKLDKLLKNMVKKIETGGKISWITGIFRKFNRNLDNSITTKTIDKNLTTLLKQEGITKADTIKKNLTNSVSKMAISYKNGKQNQNQGQTR